MISPSNVAITEMGPIDQSLARVLSGPIPRDLDAVSRTPVYTTGSTLPTGMISLEQARRRVAVVIPMAIKRFDFLAKGGGDISVEELLYATRK